MKEVTISVNSASFPSQFVSDSEKASMEFGLQVGQAIQYEWFRRGGGDCKFYRQLDDFHRLRLYARGEQSVGKYKNELAVDGDLSYLNLDWTPIPIIPKFVDIVVNGMSDRLFSINTYAQDAMSAEKRIAYQDMIETDMVAKDFLEQMNDSFGIDAFAVPQQDIPESDEELALHMQLKYKPSIEIAQEQAINTVLDENHYDEIKKRVNYDLTTIGMGAVKHSFLPGAGVKVDYVDPANLVYSYTEDNNFRDCFYWGEIKTVPVTELRKIDPTLTNEDLDNISKYSQSWYDYYNVSRFYENSMFNRDTATLLYFSYKTDKSFVYKKKMLDNGGQRMIEKDDSFNPPEEMMADGRLRKN